MLQTNDVKEESTFAQVTEPLTLAIEYEIGMKRERIHTDEVEEGLVVLKVTFIHGLPFKSLKRRKLHHSDASDETVDGTSECKVADE